MFHSNDFIISGFSDAVIFLFLGVSTIRDTHVWQTGFILWTCLLCTVVRFAGVYLLTALLNNARIKKISWKEQFILSYGGLRGAVGFSLVEILKEDSNPYKTLFVTTTLFMIGFTVFLQGGTIKLFVEKLKIRKKVAAVSANGCRQTLFSIVLILVGRRFSVCTL